MWRTLLNNGLAEKNFLTYPDSDGCDTISCKEKYKKQILNNQAIVEKIHELEIEGYLQWYLMAVSRDSKSIGSDKFTQVIEEILNLTKQSECPTESKS